MKYDYLAPQEKGCYKIPADSVDTLFIKPTTDQLMIWLFACQFFRHKKSMKFGCVKCRGKVGMKVVGVYHRGDITFYAEVFKNRVTIRAIYNYTIERV